MSGSVARYRTAKRRNLHALQWCVWLARETLFTREYNGSDVRPEHRDNIKRAETALRIMERGLR